jgi:hypothetical protein
MERGQERINSQISREVTLQEKSKASSKVRREV